MAIFTDTKILVIDDDQEYRDDNVKKLVELGFEKESIMTAVDGLEALQFATDKNNNFDLFIVDLVMPKMTGLEFIEELNKIERYEKTPKLILSSSYDRSVVLDVARKGATSFLIKPLEIKAFALKIIHCLEG